LALGVKRKMKLIYILIPLVLLQISTSFAGNKNSDFKCTVNAASNVNSKGDFEKIELWKFYINKEFTVERRSGVVSGKNFKNNIAGIKPAPYNDEFNSYSVVSVSAGSNVINYLQINKSEETKLKPFIYIMTNVVLTGVCHYY